MPEGALRGLPQAGAKTIRGQRRSTIAAIRSGDYPPIASTAEHCSAGGSSARALAVAAASG